MAGANALALAIGWIVAGGERTPLLPGTLPDPREQAIELGAALLGDGAGPIEPAQDVVAPIPGVAA